MCFKDLHQHVIFSVYSVHSNYLYDFKTFLLLLLLFGRKEFYVFVDSELKWWNQPKIIPLQRNNQSLKIKIKKLKKREGKAKSQLNPMGVFLNKETTLEHYQEILLFASNVAENSLLKSNKLS